MGYVRSKAAARRSAAVRAGLRSPDDPLPWRDYPPEALTDIGSLLPTPFERAHLLIGCRNVLNELGYQARLGGHWWRRAGEPPVDPAWPVLAAEAGVLGICRQCDVERPEADLITGVPLVIDGKAATRSFLVAHCSDVAHSYEVHPRGWIGPSSAAWSELSEAWQAARDQGRSPLAVNGLLARVASRHGCQPSANLLHTIVASKDDTLFLFAVTGALEVIARHLARRWRIRHALVLANGGSVGWLHCQKGRNSGTLLVSSPNWRASGTVYLDVMPDDFIQPLSHGLLARNSESV